LLAEGGELSKRWPLWLAVAAVFYGSILGLVYVHHNWVLNFNAPPEWWNVSYSLSFAIFSGAMAFTLPAIFLRLARASWRLLDAMRPVAYGIYLLHYIFVIWLQYAVYDLPLHAGAKFAIVFAGTLSMSWALTCALRRIPLVARII
jgi:surface polysaccharide O-acyltransferase-like enzyme